MRRPYLFRFRKTNEKAHRFRVGKKNEGPH